MKTLVKVALPIEVVVRIDDDGVAYVRLARTGRETAVGKLDDVLPSQAMVWTETQGPFFGKVAAA